MSSYLLKAEEAQMALAQVLPRITRMMDTGVVKRSHLSVVILDPVEGFELLVYNHGDKEEWEHPYEEIARSKAQIAFRTKANTNVVKRWKPWMFQEGDTPYGGGVYHDGIVVGVSGVEEWGDLNFASWIAEAIKEACIEKMQKEVLPSGVDFLA